MDISDTGRNLGDCSSETLPDFVYKGEARDRDSALRFGLQNRQRWKRIGMYIGIYDSFFKKKNQQKACVLFSRPHFILQVFRERGRPLAKMGLSNIPILAVQRR